jgi:hypothetical protein
MTVGKRWLVVRTVIMNDERSAMLVLRAWIENDQLRVRLTSGDTTPTQPAGKDLDVGVECSVEGAAEAVRLWLEELLGRTD